jgi:GAF domain-containing protein
MAKHGQAPRRARAGRRSAKPADTEAQKIAGFRTILGVPLLRERKLLGIFSLNRNHADPFTDKEIELASSFADQAVIAIENARLFEEFRDRHASPLTAWATAL